MSTNQNQKDESEILFKKHKKVRDLCLQNAEDLIESAKKLDEAKHRHIRFHLSALALEEIGKAELLEMSFVAEVDSRDSSFGESSIENHIRKLFWAFWGPSFGKKVITKQEIDQLKGLATSIHLRRLDTLYIKPTDQQHPKSKLPQEEADRLLSMAEARLGMEKGKTMLKPNDPSINKEELQWFLTANSDPEKYRLIFGRKSQEKLIELGNVRDWIHWLKQQFDQNDEEIRKIVNEELSRKKPEGKDARKPKYKIKIRINSESHSIRTKNLNEWSKHSDFVKLFSDDKSDLIIEFQLAASTPAQALWYIGWGMARSFVVALNIASRGIFWWHVQKDKARYYEEIWDLERNMKLGVQVNPELSVNFKELRWVLNENQLLRTNLLFYYIAMVRNKEEIKPFNSYGLGLAFWAKNDIHLRFELNAYNCFYQAFKEAFLTSGDWDGKSDFKEAVHRQFAKLEDFRNLDEVIDSGEDQAKSPTRSPKTPITLTEILALKMYCDIYLEIIAKRAVDKWNKEKAKK